MTTLLMMTTETGAAEAIAAAGQVEAGTEAAQGAKGGAEIDVPNLSPAPEHDRARAPHVCLPLEGRGGVDRVFALYFCTVRLERDFYFSVIFYRIPFRVNQLER